MLTCYALTCDYFTNPIGIDNLQPHLSWKLNAPQRDARQTAYQLQVTSTTGQTLWDSGEQSSDLSLHVSYAGEPLQPGQRCGWRVRVWDENGSSSVWSDAAFWEMGLLDASNWQTEWITPDWEECHVLSRFGQTDVAYELLNQESYPSWLYPVKKGATTIWERWDGIKPDGSFQDAGMNSFNHYAYGAIGEWLYRTVAGITPDPDEAGYKHTLIQPQPGGGLTQVQATLDSPYGQIGSAWELRAENFRLRVTVPPNAHATVRLLAQVIEQVSEAGQPITPGNGIHSVTILEDCAVITVGSGSYDFVTTGLTLAQAMANVKHIAGRLDRYSSLRELLADERANQVLTQELGADFFQSPSLRFVMDQPLTPVARFSPALGNPEKLAQIEAAIITHE